MLRESGRVESVHDGFVWVVCAAQIDCQRCAEGRGCGGGLLGRLLGDRLHRVRAVTRDQGLTAGDRVELSLSESALLKGAFQVYGLPLAGFIGLPLVAYWLFGISEDFRLLVAGIAGLTMGLFLARRAATTSVDARSLQPTITRRLSGQCLDVGESGQ